jgi:RND family efflux transporter MFP subunit
LPEAGVQVDYPDEGISVAEQDGIVLITDGRRPRSQGNEDFESEFWNKLSHAADTRGFVSSWLEIQCGAVEGIIRGVVVLRASDSASYAPVAVWPAGAEGSPKLAAVVERALADKRVTVEGAKRTQRQDSVFIGHPVLVDDEAYGVVALEVAGRSEPALRELVQQLGWGIGWLEALSRRKTFTSKARLVTVLELIATSLRHERFQAAATAVATELATTFGCERVSIGFLNGRHIEAAALSHSATFGKKTNLIRALEGAMDEAADQLATVTFPPLQTNSIQVTRAHAELAAQHHIGAICTVPLTAGSTVLGAMVLELPAGAQFDARTVELCEHAALLVGPVLDIKRKEDRWLAQKVIDSVALRVSHLLGPRHVALKLSVFLIVLAIIFFAIAEGDYRVTADAALEGTVQRAVTAALPGFILEARARAGDIVRKGDLLARLDDRDLQLERQKLSSQRAQREGEYSQALAEHQRSRVQVLQAQLAQVDAQLALTEEQLSRTRLVAPFDAVVVKGDLTQSLGAPVERGNVLFELAPLDAYRIIMKVDERDITGIAVKQVGHLVLSSLPQEEIPLVVEKITPVSVVDQGRNYFRVEAVAKGSTAKLRPGMEGVGKIEVERRKLFWIWTHKLTHWVRMWFWSWWP